MLIFKSFSEEYKHFIENYVLPLMGVPDGQDLISDAGDTGRIVNPSKCVEVVENKKLYFGSPSQILFFMPINHSFPSDTLKLARCLCTAFFDISQFLYTYPTKSRLHYVSDMHRENVYQMAIQRGICAWMVGGNNDSVEKLLALLEKWAVQTYEGKKVTFGFFINPMDDSLPATIAGETWLKFLENDYSAVLTDCIHSVIQLDKSCGFVRFLSLAEGGTISDHQLSPFLPLRFSQCIDKYIRGSAVGIFLLNNGDIVLSKEKRIKLVKRNLHWLNFSFNAFHDAICDEHTSWDEKLLEEVYATTLDVSFAHTGGIIAIVKDSQSLSELKSSILKPRDDLSENLTNQGNQMSGQSKDHDMEMQEIKREVIENLVAKKDFCSIDRKLRSELTAMDGACILDSNGNVISFGAIIRNDAESAGGARGAASKTLSRYGLAVKISTDGYVELYLEGEKKFSIK